MGDPCILEQVVSVICWVVAFTTSTLMCKRMSQSHSSSRGHLCNCHWDRAHLIAGRFRDWSFFWGWFPCICEKTRGCKFLLIQPDVPWEHLYNLTHQWPSARCCLAAEKCYLHVSNDFFLRISFQFWIHQLQESLFLVKLPCLIKANSSR